MERQFLDIVAELEDLAECPCWGQLVWLNCLHTKTNDQLGQLSTVWRADIESIL